MFLFIHGDTDSFLFQLKHSWKFTRQTDYQDGRIDYKCEDGHFLVSAICVPFSNPYSLTSNETRVNPQIRSWKCTFLIELDVRKQLVISIPQRREELRLYDSVSNLTISNPGLKAAPSLASRGRMVLFLVVMTEVFWKTESWPIYWFQCLFLTDSVFTSIVYG
jgi:hypothetical protein